MSEVESRVGVRLAYGVVGSDVVTQLTTRTRGAASALPWLCCGGGSEFSPVLSYLYNLWFSPSLSSGQFWLWPKIMALARDISVEANVPDKF